MEKNISSDARNWFRDQAMSITSVNRSKLRNNGPTVSDVNESMIGKMIFYTYDAKTKDKLPYWDMFPVVFPIEIYKDGYLAINAHYLPPLARAKLMDALYTVISPKPSWFGRVFQGKQPEIKPESRLIISYQILKAATKFREFKPCVKRYLFSQVRSQFMLVEPDKWDLVCFLPLAKWMKSDQERVWNDSMSRIYQH